ncbi:MAG: mechanosensitive ion channel [Ignavibacteria bacterium]|nr:mechanosensitive ion channel [Ignavibacteria bacterium]
MNLKLYLALFSLNTLFAALAVPVVLVIIRFMVRYYKLIFNQYRFFIRSIPLLQLGVLIFITINVLILIFPQSPTIISFIMFGVILFAVLSGWQFIRDFVSGMFLRIDNDFEIGSMIKIGEVVGIIKKRGYRSIELEKDGAESIQIPYSSLAKNFISSLKLDQEFYRYRFSVRTKKESAKNQLISMIKKVILNSVWTAVNREPKIIFKSEDDQAYEVEISGYVLHQIGASEIESLIKEKFQV